MRVLSGHTKAVRAVAFAPDGRLVSVGDDRTCRLWDVFGGDSRVLFRTSGPFAWPLYAVAVSPDGRTLVAGGRHPRQDGHRGSWVHGYDLARDKPDGGWSVPGGQWPRSVWSLAFAPDGRTLAAATRRLGGGNITAAAGGHWWGLSTDHQYQLLEPRAFSLAFDPGTGRFAAACDGEVVVRDGVRAAAGRQSWPLPVARPEAVAFLPGRDELMVAAGAGLLHVELAGGRRAWRVPTGLRVVSAVAALPHGRAVLAGGKPGGVIVLDPHSGRKLAEYDFALGAVHALAVSQDGMTFAAAGERGLALCDAGDW